MQVMGELAHVYALDREKAMTIGILHDAAKDLPPTQIEQLIAQGNIQTEHECENDYVHYLHGPVGSYFVRTELGITDELILDAIATHTYCGDSPHFNDPHCWCMRFADLLEPTRDWREEKILHLGTLRLREMVYAGDLEAAAYLETAMLVTWFNERGVPVHPNMHRVTEELAVYRPLLKSLVSSISDEVRQMELDTCSAQAWANRGDIEAWVHKYLLSGKGGSSNPAFSEGLKREKRWWRGPLEIDLDALSPAVGPEPGMEYVVDPANWHTRTSRLAETFTDPLSLPPLIVEYRGGELSIRDGNTRYGAMRHLGWAKCWVIVWYNSEGDYAEHEVIGDR